MENKWNRIVISASILLAGATSLANPAIAASELIDQAEGQAVAMSDTGEVPTILRNEPREGEPDGSCSTCTVDYLLFDNTSGAADATLELYFEDNGEDENADIRIRVLLVSGEYQDLILSSVQLLDGALHVFNVPSGSGWSWKDARYAWVEVD